MTSRRLAVVLWFVVAGCGGGPGEEGPDRGADADAVEVAPTAGRADLPEDQLAAMRELEPERAARALAEVETRFAERDPDLAFRVDRSTTTSIGDANVLVQQVYRGVPVEQRDLLVIVGRDDTIRVIGEPDHFDGISLPAPRPLDSAHAWAFQHGAMLRGTGERRLQPVFERRLRAGASGRNAADWDNAVVRFDSGTLVSVDGGPTYDGAHELFVRDRDGVALERAMPARAFAAADLRGYYAQSTDHVATLVDSTSSTYTLKDEWGNTVRVGTSLYTSSDNSWGDLSLYAGGGPMTTNGETAAADAFISVWVTSKMYEMVYGQTVKPTTTYVHVPFLIAADSAPKDGPDGGWAIRTGYDDLAAAVKKPMTDVEVIGHEYGHNVFADRLGTWSTDALGERGGIYEGCADIFGLNAGFYLASALHPHCSQAKFGPRHCFWSRRLNISSDWIFGNLSNHRAAVRSFMDPTIPEWIPDISMADSHEAGGPLRRMYYFLSVGILPSDTVAWEGDNSLPQRWSTYLPTGLEGLGIDTANRIWWQTLDGLYMAQVGDFYSYRVQMLNATTTLYGENSPQYKAVEDAWGAVGVGLISDRKGPDVDLISGMTMANNSYVEASASDVNGVAKVDFFFSGPAVGDMKEIGYATAPPWRVPISGWPTTDTYTLTIVATDTRGNKTTKPYYPVTFDGSAPHISMFDDVTPCNPATAEWCGDYRLQRTYRVAADDVSGVSYVALQVDGGPVTIAHAASHDFTVTYQVGGDHGVRASAVDTLGNAGYFLRYFNVDLTPPTLTREVAIAQSQSTYTGQYIDNLVEMDYCITDPSGVALRNGKQRIDVLMDGVSIPVDERTGYPAGCPSYYIHNVPAGSHLFDVRLYDKWGNYAERYRSVSVVAAKPFVFLYGVYVDPTVLGRITVNGFYNSATGHDIASIAYTLCRSGAACLPQKTESPPPGVVGSIEFDYETLGLWLGETYKAQITVTGTSGQVTTVESTWFTIPTTSTPADPPPNDVVYNEVEPNDGYYLQNNLYGGYDVVPNDVTIIRGSASWDNTDMFELTEPPNSVLCIAGARLNNSNFVDATVFLHRSQFNDGSLVYGSVNIEDSPTDITDGSYSCYIGSPGWPAIDGKYYLYVRGASSTPDDYEFHIKYISNMYRPAPPPP